MTRRCRAFVIVVITIAHAAILLVLLEHRPIPKAFAPSVVMLGLTLGTGASEAEKISADRSPDAPKPPPPPDTEPRVTDEAQTDEAPIDAQPDVVASAVASAAGAASGQSCAMTTWLQAALQADPAIQSVLPLIPRQARSVANAVMLWNAGWVESEPSARLGMQALRDALAAGIQAAPGACRAQIVHGPELLTLKVGDDVTVIAIGSGEWRWEDLLMRE